MKNKHDLYTEANTYIGKRGQKCLYVGHRLSPDQLKQDSIMLVIRRLVESGLKLGLRMAEGVRRFLLDSPAHHHHTSTNAKNGAS